MNNEILKTDQCPNCGQALHGENYCPNCGQKNDARRLSYRHVINESLSNFFSVDGRFFHTIKELFRYPGKVSKDYIEGKRVQYMNPVRIYFLSSLILLFILQFAGRTDDVVNIENKEPVVATDSVEVSGSPELDSLFNRGKVRPVAPISITSDGSGTGKLTRIADFAQKYPDLKTIDALDSLEMENNLWNRLLYSEAEKIVNFDEQEFGKYFSSKLFWVLFLFLPVLALILHFLYWRQDFYYPEHLFFTFYSQSVFFIILCVSTTLEIIFNTGFLSPLFAVGFSIYLFMAMRHFYGQSKRKTLMKFLILNLIAFPIFGVFFLLAALVALILF